MRKRPLAMLICAGVTCASVVALAPSALGTAQQLLAQDPVPVSSEAVTAFETTASAADLLSNAEAAEEESKYRIVECNVGFTGPVWTDGSTVTGLTVTLRRTDESGETITLVEGQDYEMTKWFTHNEGSDDYSDTGYTLVEGVPASTGTYYLRAQGIGDYEGVTYISVLIRDIHDIANYSSEDKTFWIDGDLSNPSISLYRYDSGLSKNV